MDADVRGLTYNTPMTPTQLVEAIRDRANRGVIECHANYQQHGERALLDILCLIERNEEGTP